MNKYLQELRVVCFGLALVCGSATARDVNETIAETGAIFTYMLDTGSGNPERLPSAELSTKEGWQIVEADVADHAFSGDAVLLNDALALVLRQASGSAELYSQVDGVFTFRASIGPQSGGSDVAIQMQEAVIEENTPGTVAVRATYQVGGGEPQTLQYRVVTGQIFVEVTDTAGLGSVAVRLDSRYLVVPDFFANDLVYDATDFVSDRAGLPAENFVIHLVEGGDALVTCVWKDREQSATAIVDRSVPSILGTDIDIANDGLVWVSLLERPDVWHEADLSAKDGDTAIDWTPPFPARWRADFLSGSESAESWNFEDEPNPAYESPFHGSMAYPCWFDSSRAFIQAPGSSDLPAQKAVIYPIDRTQGTPLNVFCLVDIMRATLGFGACQYVLDLEGLDAQSSPTPALVMEWVEKQFKAGRAERSRDTIVERLNAMTDHVTHADQRIKAYGAFGRELIGLLGDNKELATGIGVAEAARKMGVIASELEQSIGVYEAMEDPVVATREASAGVVAAIGQTDGLDRCERIAQELHAIGEAQDRILSEARMAARRIAQLAADIKNGGAGGGPVAAIREQASALLRAAS
ncbi:MAG: hypothetical protein KJ060_04885 [Candidatus Hydrogenedentes bacterium]|nr:hypothetical protein [Candidatus Hydrogenedentota bacterium]